MTQDESIEMPPYLNASYEGDDLFTGEQLRAAVLAEREACAKVCGKFADEALVCGDEDAVMCFEQAEDAIRARGQA